MSPCVIGVDFGTGSVRALLVNVSSSTTIASAEHALDTIVDSAQPELARQRPSQYLQAMESVLRSVLQQSAAVSADFSPDNVVGLGVDATGSTPLPVDEHNRALGSLPEFADNLNAQAWLWKDHTAAAQAQLITDAAAAWHQPFLDSCGGAYSSEWFWSKIWRCLEDDARVFAAAESWVECCDWLASQLVGIQSPGDIRRSACAAGHKALYSEQWGGLPDSEFLIGLAPELAALRPRLFKTVHAIGEHAGLLSQDWADRTGLTAGIAVSVANLDAHAGAVGAGIGPGQLVKVMGTSTCDCALMPSSGANPISGISGIAADSIVPGYVGIEAGQSAVGDIFAWFVETICESNSELHDQLSNDMSRLLPGSSGLIALDWHNGNRCVLADPELTGHLFGLTLHSTRTEMYRAWIEATAFGARMILDALRTGGIHTDTIICCGGIAARNSALMQIYADITGCTLQVSPEDQTCALGSVIAGAVAAGAFEDVPAAQALLSAKTGAQFAPEPAAVAIYDRLYAIYRSLHNALGRGARLDLHAQLNELRQIAVEQRRCL